MHFPFCRNGQSKISGIRGPYKSVTEEAVRTSHETNLMVRLSKALMLEVRDGQIITFINTPQLIFRLPLPNTTSRNCSVPESLAPSFIFLPLVLIGHIYGPFHTLIGKLILTRPRKQIGSLQGGRRSRNNNNLHSIPQLLPSFTTTLVFRFTVVLSCALILS